MVEIAKPGFEILDGYEELRVKYPRAVQEYRKHIPNLLSAHMNFLKWLNRYGYWSCPVYSLVEGANTVFKTRGNIPEGNWRRFLDAVERELAKYEITTSQCYNQL